MSGIFTTVSLGCALLSSTVSTAPPEARPSLMSEVLRPPSVLQSVALPSAGGSVNPMNLGTWVTLSGIVIAAAGGVATVAESAAAIPLFAVGAALILAGPTLHHLLEGEWESGLIQLTLRVVAASVLAGGLLWGISSSSGPAPFVIAGAGGVALVGLTLYGIL